MTLSRNSSSMCSSCWPPFSTFAMPRYLAIPCATCTTRSPSRRSRKVSIALESARRFLVVVARVAARENEFVVTDHDQTMIDQSKPASQAAGRQSNSRCQRRVVRGIGFFDQFMQSFMFAFVVTAEQNVIVGSEQFRQLHKCIATTAGEAFNRFDTQMAGCFVTVGTESIDRDRRETLSVEPSWHRRCRGRPGWKAVAGTCGLR